MAAGGTIVTYNDVVFWNVQIKRFHQELQMDDSGADTLFSRISLTVQGIVHGQTSIATAGIAPSGATGSGNPALEHVTIRSRLASVRKPFRLIMGASNASGAGGTVLLEADPPANSPRIPNQDANNGPKCKVTSITHVAGNTLFRVEAEFEICKVECGDGANFSGVLSNRWACHDEIDGNFYTTRTYRGRLRIASGLQSPFAFRHFVVPTLQPGLRRDRMEFVATTDGLNLEYTIVDKEAVFSAPDPATNWNYDYAETIGDGMVATGECTVTLEGDRDVNRKKLIQLGAAFVSAKLVRPAFEGKPSQTFEFFTIRESSGSGQANSVTVSGKVLHATAVPKEDDASLVEIAETAARLGKPITATDWGKAALSYQSNYSRGGRKGEVPAIEGPVQLAGAFIAYLQSPCSEEHGIVKEASDEDPDSPGVGATIEVDVREVETLPDEPGGYLSDSHKEAIYTYWQSQSRYEDDLHKIQVPIALDPATASGSDPTSVVVTLGGRTAKRIVRLKGERVGGFPELPDAVDYDDQGVPAVLLSRVLLPTTPSRTPDGKILYAVEAEYVYALTRPLTAVPVLRLGRNPWETHAPYGIQQSALTDGETA